MMASLLGAILLTTGAVALGACTVVVALQVAKISQFSVAC